MQINNDSQLPTALATLFYESHVPEKGKMIVWVLKMVYRSGSNVISWQVHGVHLYW